VMLAYVITHYLQHVWTALDMTVEEGLQHLATLCAMELVSKNEGVCHVIPTPRPTVAQLLEAANVRLPQGLPYLGARVVSRKELPKRRVTR